MIKKRIKEFLGFHKLSYQERISRVVIFICLTLLVIAAGSAQEDTLSTEVVNIVKPYSPSVSDAFKIKEEPVGSDSISASKIPLKYRISTVPVASTFTPAKGKAADLDKPQREVLYDNYALLGFGSYTSVLAELYTNFQLNRTDNVGFVLNHNSSQGGLDGVRLENKFYKTRVEGSFSSSQKDLAYQIKGGFFHRLFNWYGLPMFFNGVSESDLAFTDVRQQYTGAFAGARLDLHQGSFNGGQADLNFIADSYGSSEINFRMQPDFNFALGDLSLSVLADFDWLNGGFDQGYSSEAELRYGFVNAGVRPSIVLNESDLSVSLGAAAYMSLDLENSDSRFYIYPSINASYKLADETLIAYGGVDGGLHQNTYKNLSEKNPFVSPTLFIQPTSKLYRAFAGIRGKLSDMVAYDVRGSYGREEDKALFRLNPLLEARPNEGFRYGNSFGVVYDDINTLSVFGQLRLELSDSFSLGASTTFYSYTSSAEDEAWNLPSIEATVFSFFDFSEDLYGKVDLFFTGTRKDLYAGGGAGIGNAFASVVTLDAFADANIELGYRVNPRLNIFARGNNLIAGNYERWLNFPVLGLQLIAGATYKFDW